MTKKIRHIGIIGGGKMGTSLFNYLTNFDFKITWYRRSLAEKAQEKYEKKLNRLLKTETLSADEFNFKISNHIITSDFQKLSEPDLIIECIKEDVREKIELFRKLDEIVKNDAIIASNSSSISPTEIHIFCLNHDKIVGLHFFYPIEIKNIVEFIITDTTTKTTISQIEDFLISINKFFLLQSDHNAFILNKLMLNLQAGACQLLENQNIPYQVIDEIVKKNLFPIGIFEMLDHIGIDVMQQSVRNYLKHEQEKEFFTPLVHILDTHIQTNSLGIKSGSGFYNYDSPDQKVIFFSKEEEDTVTKYLLSIYQKTVDLFIKDKKCRAEDITFAMNEYLGTDTGKWL